MPVTTYPVAQTRISMLLIAPRFPLLVLVLVLVLVLERVLALVLVLVLCTDFAQVLQHNRVVAGGSHAVSLRPVASRGWLPLREFLQLFPASGGGLPAGSYQLLGLPRGDRAAN